MHFFEDFNKAFPSKEEVKEEVKTGESITLQDMKDYFNAMKEQLVEELKLINPIPEDKDNNIKEEPNENKEEREDN